MAQNNDSNISPDQQDQILFMMLVQQHQQIALMGLGDQENPTTGKKEKDLKAVKYAIDTLTMLEKFTAGNLTKEMSGYLTETLKSLRLKYVDANQP
jgi:hypothetical protein